MRLSIFTTARQKERWCWCHDCRTNECIDHFGRWVFRNVGRPIHWYTHAEFEKNLQAAQARNEGLPLETAWQMVRERWPNWSGWLSLGEVGFSADGSQALVDTGAGFAGLSASWHVVLLVKRGGVWQVVREFESARA